MALRNPLLIAFAGIAVILAAMLVGPVFSPPEFSWVRHSTSEQAGQLLAGAWIMRAGFVAFGAGTALAAMLDLDRRPLVKIALAVFGLGMIATAVWSNAPILPELPADMHEDWLHSVASGVVGTAFAASCAARLFAPGGNRSDVLAWGGLAVSIALPAAMGAWPEIRGLLQRAMFTYSFVFILREFAPTRS